MKKIIYLNTNWSDDNDEFTNWREQAEENVIEIAKKYPDAVKIYSVEDFVLAFNQNLISNTSEIAVIEEPDEERKPTERLHKIYDKYKEHFENNFHNALWQILVNNCYHSMIIAFVVGNMEDGHFTLGIVKANESAGYYKVNVWFKKETMYDTACDICEDINLIAFDLPVKIQNYLQLYSMKNKS